MKRLVLLSSVVALAIVFAATNAYCSGMLNFHVNGVEADTTACVNNCIDGTAQVTLDSSKNNSQTTWLVFFTIFGHDSQGNLTAIESAGPILSSMVSGNGITDLTLNLDTNAAGLQVQYCVADQFLNFTCTPFAGGTMNITWTPTKTSSLSGTSVDKQTGGGMTIQSTISGRSSSAVVQATVFGQQYADVGDSSLGTDHVGQVTITQP